MQLAPLVVFTTPTGKIGNGDLNSYSVTTRIVRSIFGVIRFIISAHIRPTAEHESTLLYDRIEIGQTVCYRVLYRVFLLFVLLLCVIRRFVRHLREDRG